MIGNALTGTVEYTAQHTAVPVRAEIIAEVPKKETPQEMGQRIAKEYEIPFEVMDSIVKSESKWNPDPPGSNDNGKSAGLVQIHLPDHPEITREQALDPEFALTFLAKEIKAGNEWKWWICNCVYYVRTQGVKLPKIGDPSKLTPNSDYPRVGGAIILKYGDVWHLALIERVTEEGIYISENNKIRCQHTERLIKWGSPEIQGYWSDVQ